MDAGDWTAIYAAFVATVAAGRQVWSEVQAHRTSLRLHRPRIENRPLIFTSGSPDYDPVWDQLVVDVVNTGRQGSPAVTVDALRVERPLPVAARFVEMSTSEGGLLEPGQRHEYSVSMSKLLDEDTDDRCTVSFRLALASGEEFGTRPYPLRTPRSEQPPAPRLKRL